MATLRELIIKISANSQSFQSEIQRASRMGSEYYRTLQNGGRQAAAAARDQRRALAELNSQLTEIRGSAVGMAGAFAGAFATGHLISLADEWSSVNARLKQASQSSDEFSSSQKVLMDISQRTGTAFSDNAALFARSAASMREYGYSADDVLKVTEAISTGLKISGASTAEAGSVITQFSQALAQGVLRGEEFNSVNESGDRIVRALAAGMGVARKDLKAMADDGQLTADKVVPALISQLEVLRDEYAAMPETVSDGITKVENAFMAWVGGANEASGVTKTLSGVLNGVAGQIDNVATAVGALVAVGVARYFGNMASGAMSATAGLVTAARNEVALAEAQFRGTQIATARARAAVYRAQQAVAAARGTEMQIAAEARLAATQERLNRNIAARSAAQNALNSTTAVGSRLMSGALGLVGGVPGLVMLGAAAWYTLYQNQEQARESARQYALTIDEIAHKTPSMSLPEASDNEGRTRAALTEQNRLIDEQASRVKSLQEKAQSIQDVLAGLEDRRVALIRQQAAEQNKVYQSMLVMNGQHTEFNRLLGLGNELLQQRQGLVNVPLRLPQATLDDKQQSALTKTERELALSRLKGEEKERARLGYAADDLGFVGDSYQEARQRYISNALEAWRNNEANKPKSRGGKSETEKAEDSFSRLLKQQKAQLALAGQNTELAKLKYQTAQGELKTLTEIQKQELLRNAALIDQQKIREQLRSREETLKNENAAARASNDAELLGYGQGERARERMRELQQIRDSFRQKDADLQSQYQTGDISEDFYRQALAQNAQYLSERLKDQETFYAESDAQRADWQKGLQEGFSNWVDNASDYASQAAQLATEGISGMVNNITEMLNGNKVEWRSWASSVLQEISKVLMNAAIVNGIKTAANGMSGAGGFLGSIGDWLGGAVANAKGGVYTSANLSAYSNSIVDTPTYFAFAKGAGLMGEAGPEAIMPLTRAADGSLGVRAVGSMNGSAGLVYSPVYHIAIQNDGTNGQIGPEAAGSLVQLIDQRVQAVMLSMRRDGGMLSG
ncbi:phage tail tape measure protein [Escherichia coli]|uniref:Phage tail length tape measure protein n=19 Tax=Escherichia coli TaxID=562 RepID=A0A0H3JEJ4_ECO57|nr:phage tail tape measure protein [Escherichia coli]NP_310010.1 phage tail length tape measure protein [Escherichia coli O157:H7 str. Sakai]AIG68460.1 Phage tail length tape-measure protein 1 [Escherichia coli O157:H7 str. EDL933]AMW46599.1 phage tail tape measure protein [Escherichia coli]AOV37932.1 phage tail tape measure protein [Escherichia coli O157:H7]AOV48687.1 phage tail tape measure protein [Escherichia coli O157:H7]APA42596.1 phage tail tape measure protein [Escherichia coli O157:H